MRTRTRNPFPYTFKATVYSNRPRARRAGYEIEGLGLTVSAAARALVEQARRYNAETLYNVTLWEKPADTDTNTEPRISALDSYEVMVEIARVGGKVGSAYDFEAKEVLSETDLLALADNRAELAAAIASARPDPLAYNGQCVTSGETSAVSIDNAQAAKHVETMRSYARESSWKLNVVGEDGFHMLLVFSDGHLSPVNLADWSAADRSANGAIKAAHARKARLLGWISKAPRSGWYAHVLLIARPWGDANEASDYGAHMSAEQAAAQVPRMYYELIEHNFRMDNDPEYALERELARFDPDSHFSDDHRVWSAGERNTRRIREIAAKVDAARVAELCEKHGVPVGVANITPPVLPVHDSIIVDVDPDKA